MSENFAELFKESIAKTNVHLGSVIIGTVLHVGDEFVTVHAGLKSEGHIPIDQFLDEQGQLEVAVGDKIEVVLDAVEDGWGETRLSRNKAKQMEAWTRVAREHKAGAPVKGV